MNRRSWLKTAAGLLVAPAVVRAESLMPVRPLALPSVIVHGQQLGVRLPRHPEVLRYSIVSGQLPKGLSLNAITGMISGVLEELPKDGVTIRARAHWMEGYQDLTPLTFVR